jgi:hypothetical protein
LQYEPRPSLIRKRYPLSLVLDGLTTLGDARKEGLTVLVDVQVGDDQVGGGQTDGDGLAVGLLADNTLNVNDVLQTVDGGDTALTALLGTTGNGDGVVNAEGNSADL